MNKLFLIVVLFAFSNTLLANKKIADSLNYEIINTSNAVKKAKLQLDYCWEIKYEDLTKCLSITKKSMATLEKANDQEGVAKGDSYMGVYMFLQDSVPEAILYLERAEKMLLNQDNPNLLSRVYNNFGVLYSSMYDNETALQFYKKSLAIKEQSGDTDISSNLINISAILYDQGKYQECIETNEQTLIYTLQKDDYESTAVVYSNLGAANERLGNYKTAINYTLKALDLYQNTVNNEADEARTYSNLGANYLSQNKISEAKYYFNIALDINKRINHKSNITVSNNNLAEVERKLKNYKKAREYALKALEIGTDLNYAEERRISFEELSLIAEDQKDFELSLWYYKKYVSLSDSITEVNQNASVENTLIQNQLALKKIQSKKDKKDSDVLDKKIILMNVLAILFIILLIIWLLRTLGILKTPTLGITILNYLIPLLFSASMTMFILLTTNIPKKYELFENFLSIFIVLILGAIGHLLLHKYSTTNFRNVKN